MGTLNMGSLKQELEIPAQYAAAGEGNEEEEEWPLEDDDIMILGSTPKVQGLLATSD